MKRTEIVTIGDNGRSIREIAQPSSQREIHRRIESFRFPCVTCAFDGSYVHASTFIKKRDPLGIVSACVSDADMMLDEFDDTSRVTLKEAIDGNVGWKLWPMAIQLMGISEIGRKWSESATPFCMMCLAYFETFPLSKSSSKLIRVFASMETPFIAWTKDGTALPVCDFHADCLPHLQVKKNRQNRFGGVVPFDDWKNLGVSSGKRILQASLGAIVASHEPAEDRKPALVPPSEVEPPASVPVPSRRPYRSVFGVSNRFTESVADAMERMVMIVRRGAGEPPDLDTAALLMESGLDKETLRAVLADAPANGDGVDALVRVLPPLKAYFVRRPAPTAVMKASWKSVAHDGLSKHRLRTGCTVQEQASLLGMTLQDFQRMEEGEFSPSWEEFDKLRTVFDEFKNTKISIGIPQFSAALDEFVKKNGMKRKRLASLTRIPLHRLDTLFGGGKPIPEEFSRLRNIIPGLPSWFAPEATVSEKKVGSPESVPEPESSGPILFVPESSESILFVPEPESTTSTGFGLEESAPEPESARPKNESFYTWLALQTQRQDPVGDLARDVAIDVVSRYPAQFGHEHPYSVLRERLDASDADPAAVEALDRAWEEWSGEPAPSSDDSPDSEPVSDPVPTLSSPPTSLSAPVVKVPIASEHPGLTHQERTRIGLMEEALLQLISPIRAYKRDELFPKDHDGKRWQLEYLRKLVSINVLVKNGERFFTTYTGIQDRVEDLLNKPEWLLKLFAPSADIRMHEVPTPGNDGSDDGEPDENVESALPAVVPDQLDTRLEELQRLLPQYFDVLSSFRDRIISLESQLDSAHSKLDAMMSHFNIPTPVLANEEETQDKDEDGSNG